MNLDWFQALVLGIVQGATEFLPVSSSAHLLIIPPLLGWPEATLTFDVVVHLATALAVLIYFRDDWFSLFRGALEGIRTARVPWANREGRLLTWIVLASIPAAVAGLAFEARFEAALGRGPGGLARDSALQLLITGVLLVAAEWLTVRREGAAEGLSLPQAMWVGVAQAIALVPGISRSGATIAGGLAVGLSRAEATRFSFLLAAPIILGASGVKFVKFAATAHPASELIALGAGFVASFVVGYLSIRWLLDYVKRAPLYVFAAYTWIFGLVAWWLLRNTP